MRRKDRETSRETAEGILDACPYGVLSTVQPDGTPYGTPISFVRDGDWLYFHGAKEGQKINNLRACPQVCAAFVGDLQVLEKQFSLGYTSAVVFGTAEEVTEESEKIHGLRLLCLRYAPNNIEAWDDALERNLHRTGVWKIRIDRISGKCNPIPAKT